VNCLGLPTLKTALGGFSVFQDHPDNNPVLKSVSRCHGMYRFDTLLLFFTKSDCTICGSFQQEIRLLAGDLDRKPVFFAVTKGWHMICIIYKRHKGCRVGYKKVLCPVN
jgi:hypothetical protein